MITTTTTRLNTIFANVAMQRHFYVPWISNQRCILSFENAAMSDEGSQESQEDSDQLEKTLKLRPSFVDATHKLNAEALRRLRLAQGNEPPQDSSENPSLLMSQGNPELSSSENRPDSYVEQDTVKSSEEGAKSTSTEDIQDGRNKHEIEDSPDTGEYQGRSDEIPSSATVRLPSEDTVQTRPFNDVQNNLLNAVNREETESRHEDSERNAVVPNNVETLDDTVSPNFKDRTATTDLKEREPISDEIEDDLGPSYSAVVAQKKDLGSSEDNGISDPSLLQNSSCEEDTKTIENLVPNENVEEQLHLTETNSLNDNPLASDLKDQLKSEHQVVSNGQDTQTTDPKLVIKQENEKGKGRSSNEDKDHLSPIDAVNNKRTSQSSSSRDNTGESSFEQRSQVSSSPDTYKAATEETTANDSLQEVKDNINIATMDNLMEDSAVDPSRTKSEDATENAGIDKEVSSMQQGPDHRITTSESQGQDNECSVVEENELRLSLNSTQEIKGELPESEARGANLEEVYANQRNLNEIDNREDLDALQVDTTTVLAHVEDKENNSEIKENGNTKKGITEDPISEGEKTSIVITEKNDIESIAAGKEQVENTIGTSLNAEEDFGDNNGVSNAGIHHENAEVVNTGSENSEIVPVQSDNAENTTPSIDKDKDLSTNIENSKNVGEIEDEKSTEHANLGGKHVEDVNTINEVHKTENPNASNGVPSSDKHLIIASNSDPEAVNGNEVADSSAASTGVTVPGTSIAQSPGKLEVENHDGILTDQSEELEDSSDFSITKEKSEHKVDVDGTALEEEEELIPVDFYYNKEDFVSLPHVTENMPRDLMTLHHSFGYECMKRSNLYMVDSDNLILSVGNYLQILNLRTNEQTYLRTLGGGGIGAIVVHPSKKHFAVAEKGCNPYIAIYEFPSLKLYRILRNGTEKAYSHLDFSPDGEKLASVGAYPDFMLTIWNWRQEKVVLRSKAFSQDVFKIAFSPENEEHLCSSGTGHIRFWTMALTFTGLKLQGELGRFGTTELSDIAGFVELPDGKVLSGSEWGNMLLWDGGLIKVEICRKGKKFCHQGTIQQFYLDEGELITIGDDGFVKVWDFETIDVADSSDESKLFEMDPMSELKVGADVKLMFMVKSEHPQESSIWYAQDASGGIWKLDLSLSHTSQRPFRIQSCHAGKICGVAVSPLAHLAATVGIDGTVRIYDYLFKTPLYFQRFNMPATSITWIPKVVDADANSILVGFNDGVLRQLTIVKTTPGGGMPKKENSGVVFKLVQVYKPHTEAIQCVSFSADGKFLATGGDDNTVFFFQVGKQYTPVGFIETSDKVVSLDWSLIKQGNTLLVCCRDGSVLEVACPKAENFDTSKTFLLPLTGLKRKEFKFVSVKDDLLREEEERKKAEEEEEKRKRDEEEKRLKRERGIVDEEEEGTEEQIEDGKEKEEEDAKKEAPEERVVHPPGNIVRGFYKGDKGDFWLSVDGWDAGYFYECAFPPEGADSVEAKPLKAIKLPDLGDIVTKSWSFSKTGHFLVTGLENGSLRIYSLEGGSASNLSSYWSLNIHDNDLGQVTDLALSYDERFLLSVGGDGNFFVQCLMDENKLKEILSKKDADIPVKKSGEEVKTVDDIDDPNYYSIELEKQKAEHDKMVKLAEEKKQKVREIVSICRRDFKKLHNQAKELPSYLQLDPSEFVIDPKLKEEIDKETKEKIDLLKKELAWNSEKERIAMEKIQKRFLLMIDCDRITLHAFNTEHEVCSYRATKLSSEFHSVMGENRLLARGGTNVEGDALPLPAAKRTPLSSRKAVSKGDDDQGDRPGQAPLKSKDKVSKAIEKADQRRQRRLARQAEWDELNARKPDENYEDPGDVAAIIDAEKNIGDFKLKTAEDFVVPESQRVNAEKKRFQLMELQQRVKQRKIGFNQKLLALRRKKTETIEKITGLINRIENIQNQLPLSLHVTVPSVPTMRVEEQPELVFQVSKEQLLNFKGSKEESLDQIQEETGDADFGGFGGFGGEPGPTSNKATSLMASTKNTFEQRGRSTSIVSSASSQPHSTTSPQHDRGSPETIFEEQFLDDKPTALESRIQNENRVRLIYQRDGLLNDIRRLKSQFDADLRLLRHEKMSVDVELKNADLREITLYEELLLLKEFEKRENMLFSKVSMKLQERREMQRKGDDCQLKIEGQKAELEMLQEKEKALLTTLAHTIGENNKFEAFLTRVFKKKIKRAKRKEENTNSEDDSEEEDSDDDYNSDDEDRSDAEELDDSVCPSGCDQSIFDQVCQLRERRLDLEEIMTEEKKLSEFLKKEMEAVTKKGKIMDAALKAAEADLEAFQLEKQRKLNELDVVVTLKLSQIQYVLNSTVPQDLKDCLVFNAPSLGRLQGRIKELEREKGAQKKLYKQRRQQHVQLIRDKKLMEAKIVELEDKVRQAQMFKFGRLIDLEKLETVSVNRIAEELKEKLRAEEFSSANEVANWEKKIDSFKARLTMVTRENTKRLDTYTTLLQENKNLELELDCKQKNMSSEFHANTQADMEERRRLVQLVQLQSQEMESLREEITLLSKKGGHVLPPSQPPLTSASQTSPSR